MLAMSGMIDTRMATKIDGYMRDSSDYDFTARIDHGVCARRTEPPQGDIGIITPRFIG